MKLTRELLFELKFIRGITNLQVNKFIGNMQMRDLEEIELTAYDIANLAELVTGRMDFLESFSEFTSEKLEEKLAEHQFITILDDDYPELLREIYNPPTVLFYQGDISLLRNFMLGAVGSRESSELGAGSVHAILAPVTKYFTVVSGLATGIDGVAHKLTIKNGGKTIGVVGNGLDIYYPKHHRELQEYMGKSHLLLSEYPNGTAPRKYHFPDRNRIIAGLSLGVVVFEAKIRSGSLITAERAMEGGREVFAVPGEIVSGRSSGCHFLIQQGAKCTYKATDILEEYFPNFNK